MEYRKLINCKYDKFFAGINDRCKDSLSYIDLNYSRKEDFFRAFNFTQDLNRAITAETGIGFAIKLFASIESIVELDNSINMAFSFQYKSAFDSLRRVLEISILSSYFNLKDQNKNIEKWINSEIDTPSFSNVMVTKLKKNIFQSLNDNLRWESDIKELYWYLCDYSHTKGSAKSITQLNSVVTSGIPKINSTSLNDFLETYIKVVQNVAIIYSVNCPILLVGLPINEKLGFQVTFGLFNFEQAKNLKLILPEKYKDFFNELISNDSSIKTRIEVFNKMPTSEEYIEMKELLDFHNEQLKK